MSHKDVLSGTWRRGKGEPTDLAPGTDSEAEFLRDYCFDASWDAESLTEVVEPSRKREGGDQMAVWGQEEEDSVRAKGSSGLESAVLLSAGDDGEDSKQILLFFIERKRTRSLDCSNIFSARKRRDKKLIRPSSTCLVFILSALPFSLLFLELRQLEHSTDLIAVKDTLLQTLPRAACSSLSSSHRD